MADTIKFEFITSHSGLDGNQVQRFVGISQYLLDHLVSIVDFSAISRVTLTIDGTDSVIMKCYQEAILIRSVSFEEIQRQQTLSDSDEQANQSLDIEIWKKREMLKSDIYQALTHLLL